MIGFYPPEAWSVLLSITEFLGGILVLIGLFTRPAAFATSIILLVTIWFHWVTVDQGLAGAEKSILWFAVLVYFCARGAGGYSLDARIGRGIEGHVGSLQDPGSVRSPFDPNSAVSRCRPKSALPKSTEQWHPGVCKDSGVEIERKATFIRDDQLAWLADAANRLCRHGRPPAQLSLGATSTVDSIPLERRSKIQWS